MTLKKCIFFLFFELAKLIAPAQSLPSERYTTKHGLLSDRITAITQDEKGFMWFGSYFGICRYDGQKFESIPLASSQQNKYVSFITPANHKVYAGFLFNGGLAEYSHGFFRTYFIRGKDSAASNEFTCLYDNGDGSIFLCNSANQLYCFRNGVFTHLLTLQQEPTFYPRFIEKDEWNNLWIATEKGLFVSQYPYRAAQQYFAKENISSLVKDKKGRLWFSRLDSRKEIIETCRGWKNGFLVEEQISTTIVNPKIAPLAGNATGGFWAVSRDNGLINVSGNGILSHYQVPLDVNADINTVFADRENNLWIANEPGVLKISNFHIQSYLFDEAALGGGAIFPENDSLLWVANSKNIYRIGTNITKERLDPAPPSYYGDIHVDARKNLWVSLWSDGIWCIKRAAGKLVEKKFYSSYNNIAIKGQQIAEDSEGDIWVGGMNGIFRIRNNKIEDHYQPLNALGAPAFVTCLSIDEKNRTIWLGDNDAGLIQVNYQINHNKATYSVGRYITNKDGLGDMYTRSIAMDKKNNLWVGTRYGGIFQVKQAGKNLKVYNKTSEAKLSCTRIADIAIEDTTAVWFASCNGAYRYLYETGQWQQYTTSDGLLNAEIFALHVNKKAGYAWVLTSQGVTRMQINKKEETVLPLINITGISVLGKTDTAALFSGEVVQYSYKENSIGFSFSGASFIDEKKVRYRYMLQGYDKEWSEPVITNGVNYASLSPGNYIFKVMSANAKGQWSEKPASFAFEITMPFYKKPWFVFLLLTMAATIFYLIRLQRLRNRFKIEKLRLAIARDLHDDVGATLGSINILTKTATRKLEKNPASQDIGTIFQKIGHSAENTLEAMDDIVWSINPDKDKVQDLVIRMREYAIPLFEAKSMAFHFETGGNPEQALAMNLRRNIFLIYKESIHNILKHSAATCVDIRLELQHHRIFLNVADNGKGFDPTAASGRNGVKNMRHRAAMSHGSLTIHSSTTGSQVVFTAPIR